MSTDIKPRGNEYRNLTIQIDNLPTAAYDAMKDHVQLAMNDLMRKMGQIRDLLTEDSKISCVYSVGKKDTQKPS